MPRENTTPGSIVTPATATVRSGVQAPSASCRKLCRISCSFIAILGFPETNGLAVIHRTTAEAPATSTRPGLPTFRARTVGGRSLRVLQVAVARTRYIKGSRRVRREIRSGMAAFADSGAQRSCVCGNGVRGSAGARRLHGELTEGWIYLPFGVSGPARRSRPVTRLTSVIES